MSFTVLLGPQRSDPLLAPLLEAAGIGGRLALVTAGWRERESDDGELRRHLGDRVANLRLYERAEEIFATDPELFEAHRASRRALHRAHTLYRLRLDHQMAALTALLARRDGSRLVEAVIEEAFATLRRLDAEHVTRMVELEGGLGELELRRRPAVAAQIEEVETALADCEALLVAGGHVGILLSRLRLFGLLDLWGERPVLAWSAGAMALAAQVVLFHDSPPQGFGNAEVYDRGLARFAGLQPLPHARRRLRLGDRRRVEILARRLAPVVGVPLDPGEWVVVGGELGVDPPAVRRLTPEGGIDRLEVG